ncbi:MAG: type I DNA topoisomerase [Lachnospiraceae bacterium]|nr:type I DNA topoisomerase [Lachnospiraceae bacterium]
MAKYLVIVESPAKVKTIKKFLGSNYEVMASNGHVRDLPKSRMGIDVDHDFDFQYITIRGKGELLAGLRKAVKKADKIYLATDPDREGEAISWHLMKALKLDEQEKQVYRITFNEITKNAVKDSLKNARKIDMSLVDAQQARRGLDRLVGYQISPVLWGKIKRGLSAGRVQSVALRMICDREEEISAFIPKEYWSLDVDLLLGSGKSKATLPVHYYGKDGKKEELSSKAQVDEIIAACRKDTFEITELKRGERVRKAPLPFTTSTLQQEASKALNFSAQKTMRLAQQLYEGVEIKGSGTVALITYLRTDSTRVSAEASAAAKSFIESAYGKEYVAASASAAKQNGNKVQDAHEAIRPTDIERIPSSLKNALPRDLMRLYQLIWKRFAASFMAPAVYTTISAKWKTANGGYLFTASDSALKFAGFMSVYTEAEEKEDVLAKMTPDGKVAKSEEDTTEKKKTADIGKILNGLKEGDASKADGFDERRHFTQPPAHYTEASLVRALEEQGIGRPSTYAPTISTIMARHYIAKEQRNLFVTELGEAVNKIMKEAFPSIVDVSFTANMESLLDAVESGDVDYKTVIRNFYPDLHEAVEKAEKELENVKIEDEVSDVQCELCGRMMVVKYGPSGKFLACPGFPECRNTKPYFEKIGLPCPKCGGDIAIKRTRKGRRYYGCVNFPDCDYMVWKKPTPESLKEDAESAGDERKQA